MPYPDDFDYDAFDGDHGGETEADELAREWAAEVVEKNRKIAAALATCLAAIKEIGEPKVLTVGYAFDDMIDTIGGLTPNLSDAYNAWVYAVCFELALEEHDAGRQGG